MIFWKKVFEMKTTSQYVAQIGYIAATVLVIIALCLPLLTFSIPEGASLGPGLEFSELYEIKQKGISQIAFWPAIVCSVIGSISILVKYRRVLVFVLGLVSSVNLLSAFIYTQNIESGLILGSQYSSLDIMSIMEYKIEVGAYVCLIAAVLIAVFAFMNFLFVRNYD